MAQQDQIVVLNCFKKKYETLGKTNFLHKNKKHIEFQTPNINKVECKYINFKSIFEID